jgi:hypothetical protein
VLLDGGLRKVRFAAKGRGKSGGVRVIYYFHGDGIPIFLLDLFAKGEKDNLTRAELGELVRLVKQIAKAYGE